jgi:hypothetical protein
LPGETTSVAYASVNGSPARELIPSDEAARIIEAVLTHVAGQRGESGAMPRFVRHLAPVAQPSVPAAGDPQESGPAEGKPSSSATTATTGGGSGNTAGGSQPKAAQPVRPAPEAKPEKKQNFVRRWFVGRAQG